MALASQADAQQTPRQLNDLQRLDEETKNIDVIDNDDLIIGQGSPIALIPSHNPAVPQSALEFPSPVKTAVSNCVSDAIKNGAFEKANVSTGVVLDLQCGADASLALETLLTQIGVHANPVTFSNNDTGIDRLFGSSHCYVVQQKADGTPTFQTFCRLVLGVGDVVVRRF